MKDLMTERFRYTTAASAVISLMLLCTAALAIPSRPQPPRLVNDFAGLFTSQQTAVLENMLTAFDDSTSNQITVVTVKDLEGYDPSEYATRIGLDWGVGAAKYDNGIVMLVKPKTADSKGQVNISVGYGLEGAIPDVYAKRIIDNEMIPRFAENDYFAGIYAGCEVLMKLASGEISEPREQSNDDAGGIIAAVLLLIFIIFLVGAFRANGKGGGNNRGNGGGSGPDLLDMIIIGNLLGGGHSSRRSSGGFGGFSGGGFGGFGGGSFGGGGASGSW